jgi:hypothetical protein
VDRRTVALHQYEADFVVGDLDLAALLTKLEIKPYTDMLPGKGELPG